jgi:hypothetical protein
VAVVSRSLLSALVSAPAARAGALGALAAFGSLHALYFVNVSLLPGEHYLAWKSLLADVLVVIPMLAGAVSLGRARWAQAVRERWGHIGAAGGAVAIIAGLAAVVAATPHPPVDPDRHGAGPDLVLVVQDSLRADRLQTDSASLAAPELARLAGQGRVYTSAWAASSWTVPSVARTLAAAAGQGPTLAERLAAHGYRTACFTDNPHLTRGTQLLRGFDRVERSVGVWRAILVGTALGEVFERLAPGNDARLATKATAWLQRQSGPFFLYVHLMDSHTPYRFPPLDGRRRGGRRIEFPMSGMRISGEEADSIRARYDGGVHSADAQVGRLVAALAARERPFLAVVTSDHGESLGEDGRWFHGRSLAPELLAIPLVILGSGVEPDTVASPVGHAAISTTLLAAASVPCPDCVGPDLRREAGPGVAEGGLPPRLAYRISGGYKLLLDLENKQRFLFDLRSDPAERNDIARTAPELVAALGSGLSADPQPSGLAPEQLERLRSLGYIGY